MVKIRLRRVGKKKQPTYRVVVADARSPRDGRFIEIIGHYNPRTDPPTVVIKEDRALYWLSTGAQPTDPVDRMLRKMGIYEKLKLLRQGASIEELVAPPEPEVTEVEAPGELVAEGEPVAEAEAAVAEAEAIVEAAAEEVEAVAEAVVPAEEREEAEEAEAVAEAVVPSAEEEEAEVPEAVEAAAEVVAPEEEEAEAGAEAVAEAEAAGAEVAPTEEAEAVVEAEEVEAPGPVEALSPSETSVESLELSTRVVHVLSDAGLHTVQDVLEVLAKGEAEFLSIPGVGGKALEEVREQLMAHGFLAAESEEAA